MNNSNTSIFLTLADFLKEYCDYIIILTLFVVPPILSGTSDASEHSATLSFPAMLIYFLICAYIIQKSIRQGRLKPSFSLLWTFIILTGLLLSSLIWNTACNFFNSTPSISMIKPQGTVETMLAILSILLSALYEELVYRQFLPETTLKLLRNRIISELAVILLFALGHMYAGIWAVLNAFIAGILLRLCFTKTGSFITGFTAHTVYNIIILFLLNS